MKEIIEYILSAILLVSIIPIYNYVVDNLYSPPMIEVDLNYAYSIAERIASILDRAAQSGNLSSPFFNPLEAVARELGDLGTRIGLHVELISIGVSDIRLNNNLLEVETRIRGNLSLLLVYRNGNVINLTISEPSGGDGSTYIYRLYINNPSNLVFVASIIDDGLYRYVNYMVRDESISLKLGSMNNKLYLFSTSNLGQSLPINIVPYNWGFEIFNDTVSYRNVTRIEQVNVGRGVPGYIKVWNVYTNLTTMKYLITYDGNVAYGGASYKAYEVVIGGEVRGEKISYTVDIRGPRPRLINFTIERISETAYLEFKHISTPTYNLPVIVVKGTSSVWVAYWYPHSYTFGYTTPKDLPVTEVSLIKRIGMVDYVLRLYVWRLI